jgi:hypothetical protein
MIASSIDGLYQQAEVAFSEKKYRKAFELILKILQDDFDCEPAWQLLHKAVGKDQPMTEFKIMIAEKFFPGRIPALLEEELNSVAAERQPARPAQASSQAVPTQPTAIPVQGIVQNPPSQPPTSQPNKQIDTYKIPALITAGVLVILLFVLPPFIWLVLLLGCAAFFVWKMGLLSGNIQNTINGGLHGDGNPLSAAKGAHIDVVLKRVFSNRLTYIVMAGIGIVIILMGVNALTQSGIMQSKAWMETTTISANQYWANRSNEQTLHGTGIVECILGSALLLIGMIGTFLPIFIKRGEVRG